MALPPTYKDYDSYFKDLELFFDSCNFLLSTSNVQILNKNIFEEFPKLWVDYVSSLSLKKISELSQCENQGPMTDFFKKLSSLTPKFDETSPVYLKKEKSKNNACLSAKKQLEIKLLSEIIHQEISKYDVDRVIDLGSGLGYLPQLLQSEYGIKVLGVEANSKLVNTAKARQEKYYPSSMESVKYVEHLVTENSMEFLENSFKENFNTNAKFFIIGLHACADLSINALKLFTNISNCQGLLIMPCCYHKMQICSQLNTDHSNQYFENFPLCDTLKNSTIPKYIQRPFMRLASQCSKSKWNHSLDDKLHLRVFHLVSRAVLEVYAEKENVRFVRNKKRKIFNKAHADNVDFKMYLNDLSMRLMVEKFDIQSIHKVNDNIESNINLHSLDEPAIMELWNSFSPVDFKLATLYTILQDSIQLICENIIILDKIVYIKEQNMNLKTIDCVKVIDENISPRCLAIVLEK